MVLSSALETGKRSEMKCCDAVSASEAVQIQCPYPSSRPKLLAQDLLDPCDRLVDRLLGLMPSVTMRFAAFAQSSSRKARL